MNKTKNKFTLPNFLQSALWSYDLSKLEKNPQEDSKEYFLFLSGVCCERNIC